MLEKKFLRFYFFLCCVAFEISVQKQLTVSHSEIADMLQLPGAHKHGQSCGILADLVRMHINANSYKEAAVDVLAWTTVLTSHF